VTRRDKRSGKREQVNDSQARAEIFYGPFRSGKILMQNCAILRNALRKLNYESPGVSNDMQSSETLRNSLGLNYKSAALSGWVRGTEFSESLHFGSWRGLCVACCRSP